MEITIAKKGRKLKWAEIREKKDNTLIRIVYNPYGKSASEILEDWIDAKYQKDCKVIFTK